MGSKFDDFPHPPTSPHEVSWRSTFRPIFRLEDRSEDRDRPSSRRLASKASKMSAHCSAQRRPASPSALRRADTTCPLCVRVSDSTGSILRLCLVEFISICLPFYRTCLARKGFTVSNTRGTLVSSQKRRRFSSCASTLVKRWSTVDFVPPSVLKTNSRTYLA